MSVCYHYYVSIITDFCVIILVHIVESISLLQGVVSRVTAGRRALFAAQKHCKLCVNKQQQAELVNWHDLMLLTESMRFVNLFT